MIRLDGNRTALVALGRALVDSAYAFTTVSPETHRHVEARAKEAGRLEARSLRDIFGWSRPFDRARLDPHLFELAQAAGVLREDASLWRSTVRFSTLGKRIFVHSSYPTDTENAVFFGPDTYRFCALIEAELRAVGDVDRVLDVGCGSGAGGIVAAERADEIVLADINESALTAARVNVALANVEAKTTIVTSDLLASVEGDFDLIVANPPFMADSASRAYRDGGGHLGEDLAVRIARASIDRLTSRGRLVLYTGAAIVDGADVFLTSVRSVLDEAGIPWRYWEIDPDIFGEEIEHNDAYAKVERIAAVALVVTRS